LLQKFSGTRSEAVIVSLALASTVFTAQWAYSINLGDEGYQWYISQRILFGEMPIRDTFSYDPGRYFWSAIWFQILGSHGLFDQRLANAIFGAVGLCAIYLAMAAARVQPAVRICCALVTAVAMGYPLHKVYEQSSSLIGVAMVAFSLQSPESQRRWLFLGTVTGLIATVGRNSGVYLTVGAFVALLAIWRIHNRALAWRCFLAYAVGVAIGYLPMMIWFVADAKFRAAMIETILFTPRWQLPLPIPFPWRITQRWASVFDLQNVAVGWFCLFLVAAYAIYGVVEAARLARKEVPDLRSALGIAAIVVGIPYLHQSLDRADFSHIAQGAMPVFVLLATRLKPDARVLEKLVAGVIALVALAAWLPSEPRIMIDLLRRQDERAVREFRMDGRVFHIDSRSAALLDATLRLARQCRASDGQVIAMPYYPGILAVLNLRSPTWEMFYLTRRSYEFQHNEIARMEYFGTRVAIVNKKAAMDGDFQRRIDVTNPLLYQYIEDQFSPVDVEGFSEGDPSFFIRNCTGQ
jgi:hypothetical protein